MTVYKKPPTLQAGSMRAFPPSPRELLEHSAYSVVTSVYLQYQTTGHRAIISKERSEPG
jgi:hypothetical protein